ncbi:AAA family ATPase [Photobacterium sp. SP02]|uniref:AAA family ATPase n=1 Tax=Photobacterium sp. SP02 TaxID=3032280 RepID=UPI003144FAB5
MELKSILALRETSAYCQQLQQHDKNYENRMLMLDKAQAAFQAETKLSEMTPNERSLFLGVTSQKHHSHDIDPNLFGAPGGNGEVGRIIASQFHHLDDFFAAIPRKGEITEQQYMHLVELFRTGVKASGGNKYPFVFFTRILTVSRPDYFVSAAADALKPLCKALGLKQVKDTAQYWRELLTALHALALFRDGLGSPSNPLLALIDGIVWIDSQNTTEQGVNENTNSYSVQGKNSMAPEVQIPLNQILYGPPGTGKTYHSIEAAVRAAEPAYVWESREELKAKYDALVDAKRIRFVTFHQSYGYEDFVEGLIAETTEDKQVTYRIKDGIFKQICNDATVSKMHVDPTVESNGRVWKLSIEGAHKNATKTYCLEHNLGAIGWGDTGDLSKEERNDYFKTQGTNNQNSLTYFCNEMTIGDLVLCIDSKTSIEAVGVVIGDYQYVEDGLPGRRDYCHQLPIKWLAKGFSVDFKSLNDNKQFSLPTCYPLGRLSVGDVLSHLKSHDVHIGEKKETSVKGDNQNYVLVIDEINRGNISKIFGELITLIEDSKRGGRVENISLTLPYSNKPFAVPENLYIIGTMNTADRSLAMMDTALRRRFDFVEMMPEPSVLSGAVVKGIDLETLLKTLNERIEILYDREHTLGHAFFMPVKTLLDEDKEEEAFAKLVSVFQNKVVPLLQEYFFEDWQKIRLVLGDNLREGHLQLIRTQAFENNDLDALFGKNHNLSSYGEVFIQYSLKKFDESVWQNAEVYRRMYAHPSIDEEIVIAQGETSTEVN